MHQELPSPRALVLYALLFEGGMGAAACGIGWAIGFPVWQEVIWNELGLLWGLAACLPMLAAFAACVRWPWGPLASIKRFSDEVITPLFQRSTMLDLAVISVLAGIGEELLFRGLLQSRFAAAWGEPLGLVLASAIFGLLHPFTPSYAVLAALIGLYLGWTYQMTGNLLVPILAHGLYDFVALVVLARRRTAGGSETAGSTEY